MKKKLLLIALALILVLGCFALSSCKPGNTTDTESQSGGLPNIPDDPDNPDNPSNPGEPGTPKNTITQAHYLRVVKLNENSVDLKLNVYDAMSGLKFDVRYSENEITEENFRDADIANFTANGNDEVSITVKDINASASNAYYIAVRPYIGNTYGNFLVVRAGGTELIPVDYNNSITNVYHGESLHWGFEKLFDEQADITSKFYFPETNMGVIYSDNDDNQLEGKVGMLLRPIIDMEYLHFVTSVELYFGDIADDFEGAVVRWAQDEVSFDAENSAWDGYFELDIDSIESRGWNTFPVDSYARYVQIVFKDGQAPNEVAVYGYQEGEGDPIAKTKRPLPTMAEMMGMCGFVSTGGGYTPISSINCTTVLREYHNFGWSYNEKAYPSTASNFSTTMGKYDVEYRTYKNAGINVIPCVQWPGNIARKVDTSTGLPIKNGTNFVEADYFEKFTPDVYFLYADNMFSFAARYGTNKSSETLKALRLHCSTAPIGGSAGADLLEWLEFGNEPNGEDSRGMVPYQLAAFQSACYDGHEKTMVSANSSQAYHLGAKNADPNIKVAMAGLAGPGGRYITSMCYWLKANRTDGSIAMDAFNFHCYFSHTFAINGTTIQMGVSPEYYGIIDAIHGVIEYRDKYYPENECWITEFGWDTNPSYETMTAAHAYAEYSAHQVQAMWLVRAYLLFSSCGIDKATMYMCEDGTYDATASGKYGTCGVIGFDENGKEYKKDSYYYIYTLKNTLGNYTFSRELNSGNEDVWVFEYKNADGKYAYAVWCPTQDGTKVDDFKLNVNGSGATLVEATDLDEDGMSTPLTVSGGTVTIDVSENPVYVVMD